MKFQDYYSTLGVQRTATGDDIKRAYRRLAKEWHPDRHPPHRRAEAEQRFKAIAEANEVLSDPEKRRRYDLLGEQWRHGQDFQPPPGGGRTMSQEEFARLFGGRGGGGGAGFGGGGFSDFFAQMFGDLFGGQDGQGGRGAPPGERARRARPAAPVRGDDVEADLELTVGEALRGGKRPFPLQVAVPCESCQGQGRTGFGACPECGGIGSTSAARTVELSIPDDVHDGQVLRLRGLGGPGAGQPGDLLLQLHLVADDTHRLRGDDVEVDLPIAPWAVLEGTKVEVRVPGGTAAVKIPAGTHAGARLRLRGQGLPRPGGGRGDLLLAIRLVLPAGLSPRQQELLRELGRAGAP